MSIDDLNPLLLQRTPLRFDERSATGCDKFDHSPGKPDLFKLMKFKHQLVQMHELEGGFDLYRRTIVKESNARLRLRRLESHHTFAKANSRPFIEIIPAGEPFTIEPPRVIGEGNHRPLKNVTRSFFVAPIEGALVRGRSSIIEVDDLALADFQGEELARIDDELEFDAAIFHRDGDSVWIIASDRPALEMDEAFSLLGCRTDFFGDWLCESITKYVAATLSGHLPPAPVLIDADMNTSHRQALELMLLEGAKIVEVAAFDSVRVGRLWTAPSIGYMAFHQKLNERFKWDYAMSSPERFLPIEIEIARRADRVLGAKRGPERVFLARKNFRHRRVVNNAEIEAIAQARGFAIVFTEEFDFIEQVRLLHGARYVVAPEGSALFLRYFLRAGAKVCILNHRETVALVGYNGGTEARNIGLTIISGPETGVRRACSQDNDYAIDPNVFSGFLDEWFDPPAPHSPGYKKVAS